MPQFERITLIIESLPGARAQVQVNIPTPTPGMRLVTPAHALAIDALGWLGKQPAVAGFVYGGLHTASAITEHPTQQGLADLRWQIVHDHIGGEYIAGRACFVVQMPALPGANIMRGSVAEHFTKAVDAIAAQAKQGEQANG